jgi:hypothetical protein
MNSRAAMAWLDRPSAIRASTASSRSVSVGQQLEQVLGLDVLRQHDHRRARPPAADLARGLEALGGLGRRHPDVGQHEAGRSAATSGSSWTASPATPATSRPASVSTRRRPSRSRTVSSAITTRSWS